MMPPSNRFDDHTAEGEPHTRARPPVITENKGCVCTLAVWKTINGKSEQRMPGVDPSAAPHNSAVIKGEFWRQGIIQAGCYLTDERLGSATASVENHCFPTQNLSRLPKYDKRRL